ncbi:hypothetical protein EUGRSUZ_E02977 [Eucalyptus grandis]|uniref:Uncharacterized protein n=2 Tax=Eucalyptus grandis TaxID=71139 RepID=A0ACC3KWN9_EUCGR|nr:hypothetical protein EUGRSUZ_E02977 [Eucalyptus grandis]
MSSEKHVAVLAFPFGCHPLPLANLLRKLAETVTNVHFSFFSTATSNRDLFPPSSRAELPPNIKVYDIDNGLPAGHHGERKEKLVEQMDDIDNGLPAGHHGVRKEKLEEQMDAFLMQAQKSYQAAIDAAERDARKKVSCLFSDAFLLPAGEIAVEMHVPWVTFWVPSPCFLSAYVHAEVLRELYHKTSCAGMAVAEAETDDKALEMFRHMLPCVAAVIMNSYVEANPAPLIADLKSKFKILLLVGCSTVSFSPPPVLTSSDSDPTGCLMWLDTKDPRTVAYVCFGTVAVPSPTELSSLAEALEFTGTPFLWSMKEHMMVHLPEGFLERMGQRGKIVSWAPQSRVLSHPACGVHVTHCGYNSVFESVAGGVPMICKPFWTDNMMNGRLVKEWWKIGVGVEGGTITKSGMVKALEVVLRSEDGKEMRKKAGELRERLVDASGPGGSVRADFKSLVEFIST